MEMESDITKQRQEIPFFCQCYQLIFLSGDIEGWRETEARARGLGSGDCSPVADLEFVKESTLAKLLIYKPVTHMDFFYNF